MYASSWEFPVLLNCKFGGQTVEAAAAAVSGGRVPLFRKLVTYRAYTGTGDGFARLSRNQAEFLVSFSFQEHERGR